MSGKISIIIPVYNGENEIEISLKSVLNQTYKKYEIIIIDDGSSDNTKEVISKYLKKYKNIKYIYQDNAGVSSARNNGIENASGKYITFLDADDFWENTFLEKMIRRIKADDADISYCGYNIVKNDTVIPKKSKFTKSNVLEEYLKCKVNIHTTGWLIRKALIDSNNIRFLEGNSWGEDIEFFSECLAYANKVTCVREYLTNYRMDFSNTQLSSFSIDKIDKDYESVHRLLNNKAINNSENIYNILSNYRLPSLIAYRLYTATKMNIDNKIIRSYYDKYKSEIDKASFVNGLRSIKLKIYIFLLRKRISN